MQSPRIGKFVPYPSFFPAGSPKNGWFPKPESPFFKLRLAEMVVGKHTNGDESHGIKSVKNIQLNRHKIIQPTKCKINMDTQNFHSWNRKLSFQSIIFRGDLVVLGSVDSFYFRGYSKLLESDKVGGYLGVTTPKLNIQIHIPKFGSWYPCRCWTSRKMHRTDRIPHESTFHFGEFWGGATFMHI